jgi:acetylornithine deacetylase/succinyl-diaminopimelate desuccinylase-like protein
MAHSNRHPLDRRRRTASRIALYASLALVAATAWLLMVVTSNPFFDPDRGDTWAHINFRAMDEVLLLQEYARIDTSAATGDTLAGARFLARELEESGLRTEIEVLSPTEANLWAILEGEEPGAIVLHNHIDVEDIHAPDAWKYPPFSATIEKPWLFGRGVFDMKSVAIAQLLAIKTLAESGARPKKSVIFLATTGEETGSVLGTRWILDQHPELARRFDLVLTEGGVLEGRDREDVKYWGTEFGQKRYVDVRVGSPDNKALERLRQQIRDRGQPTTPQGLPDEVAAFLPIYAPTRDREDFRRWMADPASLLDDGRAFAELPPYVQAMFRNEVHVRGIRRVGGDEDGYELSIKVHLLPGARLEEVQEELLPSELLEPFTVEVETEPSADHGSPLDHPVLRLIEEELHEFYPDATVGPIFLPWTATDSRFFRAHGIPSYGFSPFTILTTDALQVSGANERIALPGYIDGVEIYRRLLERLATEDLNLPAG